MSTPLPLGVSAEPVGPWVDQAECRGADPELFADRSIRDDVTGTWRAAIICARCPVIDECDAHAEANLEHGIWGGKMRRGPARVTDIAAHAYNPTYWRDINGEHKT